MSFEETADELTGDVSSLGFDLHHLTGSARLAQEAQEKGTDLVHQQEVELKKINLKSEKKAIEAQIAALYAELETGSAEMKKISEQERERQKRLLEERKAIARIRKADKESVRIPSVSGALG